MHLPSEARRKLSAQADDLTSRIDRCERRLRKPDQAAIGTASRPHMKFLVMPTNEWTREALLLVIKPIYKRGRAYGGFNAWPTAALLQFTEYKERSPQTSARYRSTARRCSRSARKPT